jgi:hypothetical protein
VLPCVLSFVDGKSVDRIVGFEGLGIGDRFTTKDLETRLLAAGVLVRAKMTDEDDEYESDAEETRTQTKIIRGPMKRGNNDPENYDDDWD